MPHVCPPCKTQWDGRLSDRPASTHADEKASLLSAAPGKRRGCWVLRFRGEQMGTGSPAGMHVCLTMNQQREVPTPSPPGRDAGSSWTICPENRTCPLGFRPQFSESGDTPQ